VQRLPFTVTSVALQMESAMYLMFADEADAERGRGQKFFVYGAVFIDTKRVGQLHYGIQEIRDKFGYRATDSLKFSGCPKHITRDEHRKVKKEIVKLARQHDVVFCAYVISHAIAKPQDLVPFGINTLLAKYDEFLKEQRDVGMVLMDRLPGQIKYPYQIFKDKFQTRLDFPGGTRRLEKVIGYSMTCDGASHFASIADILLGSFRYCVNEPEKDIANAAIFPTLVRVMWYRETESGKKRLIDYGLTLRPATIRVEKHKKDYDDLRRRLRGYTNTDEDA
jgi:hypothetical protein